MANINKVTNSATAAVIKQVNEAISEKYVERRADEELFMMGVKLGRTLAEHGQSDVR